MEFPSSTDNPQNGFILENKTQRKTREKHILYMAPVQETAMEKKATFWDCHWQQVRRWLSHDASFSKGRRANCLR